MFVPYLPGMYAALGLRSPVWGIYADLVASERRQREMIRQLHMNRAAWAMVFVLPIDGRSELGFRNTHPLVWAHLQRAYRPVSIPPFPPGILWFRSRS